MQLVKDIVKIKKYGKLIAFEPWCQYWLYKETIYSVAVDGLSFNVWSDCSRLGPHLQRLYTETGKRFFTENGDVTIVDKGFLKDFAYA